MPHLDKMFPSKWLKASDLDGRELRASIRGVSEEQFDGDKGPEMKWVLWFNGAEKGLVLNLTNGRTIAEKYGPDTDGWAGRQVTLFTMMIEAFGKQTEALRVKVTPENMGATAAGAAPAQSYSAPPSQEVPPQGTFGQPSETPPGNLSVEGQEDDLPF